MFSTLLILLIDYRLLCNVKWVLACTWAILFGKLDEEEWWCCVIIYESIFAGRRAHSTSTLWVCMLLRCVLCWYNTGRMSSSHHMYHSFTHRIIIVVQSRRRRLHVQWGAQWAGSRLGLDALRVLPVYMIVLPLWLERVETIGCPTIGFQRWSVTKTKVTKLTV